MDYLSVVDFFSSQPALKFGTRDSYSNSLSLFLSFVIFGLTCYFTNDQFFDWLYQINPQVTTEISYKYNTTIPISSLHSWMSFRLEYIEVENLLIQRVAPEKFELPQYYILDLFNGTPRSIVMNQMTEGNEKDFFKLPPIKLWNQDKEDLNLTIVYIPIFYGTMKKYIKSNSKNIYGINILTENVILNLQDSDKPYNLAEFSSRLPFSEGEMNAFTVSFKTEYLEVSGSYFRDNTKTYKFFTVDEVSFIGRTSKALIDSDKLLNIILKFSPINKKTKIVYVNENDLISSFGGTLGLLMIFGNIVNSISNTYSYQAFILNSLFKFYIHGADIVDSALIDKTNELKISNYQDSSPVLFKIIKQNSKMKKNYEVTPLDTAIASISSWVPRIKLREKYKNINYATEIQDKLSNLFDLNKISMFYYNMKDILFNGYDFDRFSEFPDINLNSPSAFNEIMPTLPETKLSGDDMAENVIQPFKNIDYFRESLNLRLIRNMAHSYV